MFDLKGFEMLGAEEEAAGLVCAGKGFANDKPWRMGKRLALMK